MDETLAGLAARVQAVFEEIHRDVFEGDPAANPDLAVEVLEPVMAADTPVVVLITPWTLNGMAFPPDGRLPEHLEIAEHPRPVLANTVEPLGAYHSVNLIGDVSGFPDQVAVRTAADALAGPFRDAVAAARQPDRTPERPTAGLSRRRLLRPWDDG